MGTARPACSALLTATAFAVGVEAAPTRLCNPNPYRYDVILTGVSDALQARIQRAIGAPSSDPAMAALLGDVVEMEMRTYGLDWVDPQMTLKYPLADDVAEIAERLYAAPEIREGVRFGIGTNGSGCFLGTQASPAVNVTEYHNSLTDHYFLSSSFEESRLIDSGAAGPGWSRTGESLLTYRPDWCSTARLGKWVYRFYGTPGAGPNSHFFTAGPVECGSLRNGRGWSYEGRAFGAELPTAGICPFNARYPIYRAYNMRWLQNDSNHRHTTRFETYLQMVARGWFGEGIAFCVPEVP